MGRRKRREQQVQRDPSWEPTAELQGRVNSLARRWSRDRPEHRDDLYQEAMLAIWLKGETQAPKSHQLNTAQKRMLSVRKLGKSVDGKLDYGYKRTNPYWVISLEGTGIRMGEHIFPLHEVLPDPVQVERHVVAKLTLLEVMSWLDPEERRCLLLICQGFTLVEVASRFQKPYSAVRKLAGGLREKLRLLQHREAGPDAL